MARSPRRRDIFHAPDLYVHTHMCVSFSQGERDTHAYMLFALIHIYYPSLSPRLLASLAPSLPLSSSFSLSLSPSLSLSLSLSHEQVIFRDKLVEVPVERIIEKIKHIQVPPVPSTSPYSLLLELSLAYTHKHTHTHT